MRGNTRAVPYVLACMRALEIRGVRVLNGADAFALEISKTAQAALLRKLGVPAPRVWTFNDLDALRAREIGPESLIEINTARPNRGKIPGMEGGMPRALDIIRSEHRSIAAVLGSLRRLAREGWRAPRVDTGVFGAMVNYLENFADRVHHPKEDRYLFAVLRRRGAQPEALIAELEREHAEGAPALRDLTQSYARLEAAGDKGLPAFAQAVEVFAQAYFEHMRKEEEELFPLAERLFTAEDWAAIDRAFEENRDPIAAGELKTR